MNCRRSRALMDKLADAGLTAEESAMLDLHARGCESCSRERAALANMLEGNLAMPVPELPDDFTRRVMRRVADSTVSSASRRRLWPFAAAAVLILILGPLSFEIFSRSSALEEVRRKVNGCSTLKVRFEYSRGDSVFTTLCFYKRPSRVRREQAGGLVTISDLAGGRTLVLDRRRKTAHRITLPHNGEDMLAHLEKVMRGEGKKIGTRDGATGFRTEGRGYTTEVWVRQETYLIESRTDQGIFKWTDFVFDIDLDDSLFNLDPPEDYRVMEEILNPPVRKEPGKVVGEKDLLLGLEQFAVGPDGFFLPEEELIGEDPLVTLGISIGERHQTLGGEVRVRFAAILANLQANETWRYAGRSVKLGDATKPVCWFRPGNSSMYRVVYGDLTVRDVAPEEVSKWFDR